jgi:hypothetical protein
MKRGMKRGSSGWLCKNSQRRHDAGSRSYYYKVARRMRSGGLRGFKRYGQKNSGLNLRIVRWSEVLRPISFTRSHIFPLRTWYATVSSAIGNSAPDTSHNNRHVPLG